MLPRNLHFLSLLLAHHARFRLFSSYTFEFSHSNCLPFVFVVLLCLCYLRVTHSFYLSTHFFYWSSVLKLLIVGIILPQHNISCSLNALRPLSLSFSLSHSLSLSLSLSLPLSLVLHQTLPLFLQSIPSMIFFNFLSVTKKKKVGDLKINSI